MNVDIGISEQNRKEIAKGLSRVLADTYHLYLKTHNFHWNVVGPMFQTLHLMFEEEYNELWQAIDVVAERIRALGHFAPGTPSELQAHTAIKDEPGTIPAEQMIRSLLQGHETVARTARELLPLVEEANDQPTIDLITVRLQIHEKTAWMLRSLLER